MYPRPYWINQIETAWQKRNVLWLMGVRRIGKTVLAKSLPSIEYFDCELPSTRRLMEDPQAFLAELGPRRVVIDEIHRLPDPASLLKIGADHFPETRILATGSSTLGASARFRDTLTGRKSELWLTPLVLDDLRDFRNESLDHRLLRGGLPPMFLSGDVPERDFQEWMDSYWAKDILELFRLERRQSFQRFVELLAIQSGGMFEATRFAAPCEVSRTTISNYLAVLEATFVMYVVRPFSGRRRAEIVSAPKVYIFDTGFLCAYRGWGMLRPEDRGLLWEHFVLNEIQARLQTRAIRYWRSKYGREIDFVLTHRNAPPTAIECKWSADGFDPKPLAEFRRHYPGGRNFIVAADVDRPFARNLGEERVEFVGLRSLIEALQQGPAPAAT